MELFLSNTNTPIQRIEIPDLTKGPKFFMKRLDLIHPVYGGNKCFKLKYHLEHYKENGFNGILSFGGPFSNHLYALAGLGKNLQIPTFGIVRGFKPYAENPTLQFCQKQGMRLIFLSLSEFNDTNTRNSTIEKLKEEFGSLHIVPEGGTDELGIKGAEGIIDEADLEYDYLAIGLGTGGSISGMIRSSGGKSRILGFSALKGAEGLEDDIKSYTKNCPKNWSLLHDYHFGGFARQTPATIEFKGRFEEVNGFEIDPVYQVKMMIGLRDLSKKDYFSLEDRVLIMHTGGIQATKGYQYMAKIKGKI